MSDLQSSFDVFSHRSGRVLIECIFSGRDAVLTACRENKQQQRLAGNTCAAEREQCWRSVIVVYKHGLLREYKSFATASDVA